MQSLLSACKAYEVDRVESIHGIVMILVRMLLEILCMLLTLLQYLPVSEVSIDGTGSWSWLNNKLMEIPFWFKWIIKLAFPWYENVKEKEIGSFSFQSNEYEFAAVQEDCLVAWL